MTEIGKSKTEQPNKQSPDKPEIAEIATTTPMASYPYAPTIPENGKTVSAPTSPSLASLAASVNVEMLAYTLIAILAVAWRLSGLDFRPLSNSEAAQAVASYHFLQTGVETSSASPFLFTANTILFFLFGANDLIARVVPALVGVILVLLPLLLRRELGRTGALGASLLLLLSPTLTFFARNLEGNTIAVTAGLVALIFFLRYRETTHTFDLYAAALAGAIALTSGAAAYTILLGGALWLGLDYFLTARADSNSASDRASSRPRRNALVLFAVGLAFWSTSLLLNRRGLGDTLNLFGDWLTAIKPLGSLTSPLNLLITYEPLILIFGFAGLIYGLTFFLAKDSRKPLPSLMATWFIVGIVLYSLAGDKSPTQLAVLVVPLATLAGWFVGELVERAAQTIASEGGPGTLAWKELPVALVAIIFAAFIYLQIAQWLAFGQLLLSNVPANIPQLDSILLVGLFVVALVVIGLFIYTTMGGLRGGNFFALLVILLLVLGTIRANWLLNFSATPTTNDLLGEAQTSFQINDLVKDLELVSMWRANDPHTLTVQVQNNLGPVPEWYLRVFPNTTFLAKPSAAATTNAVITDVSVTKLAPDWISQTYRTEASWRSDNLAGLDLWRWFFFRQGGTTIFKSVKLWIPKPQ